MAAIAQQAHPQARMPCRGANGNDGGKRGSGGAAVGSFRLVIQHISPAPAPSLQRDFLFLLMRFGGLFKEVSYAKAAGF
jgi:hypothetical protein